MPMFSRSRRASSNPPIDRDTHAAATAAARLAAAPSQASLSSAAAAAALRSRPNTPDPVGSLITKRMQRRGSQASVESSSVIGSGTRGGVARGGLHRTNSGGSMTERTFRSPSPGASERGYGAVSPSPDAPPVPAIPRDAASRGGLHQRSSSLDPPQRVMSPARGRGTRGVSVDRGGTTTPVGTSRKDKRLSNVAERDELERQSNSNLRNFSRPMSSSSPTTPSPAGHTGGAKKYTHSTGSWFSQPSGSADVSNARSGGGLLRKKKPASIASTDDLPSAMSYVAEDAVMIYDPNTRTFTAKPREKPKQPVPLSPTLPAAAPLRPGTYDPNTRSIVPSRPEPARRPSDDPLAIKKQRPFVPPVETKLEPPPRNPARVSPSTSSPSSPRAMGFLHKQPSVVREDPEAEDEAAASSPVVAPLKPAGRTVSTSAGPAKAYIAPRNQHQRSASLDIPRGSDGPRGRNESLSPARSAHFSPALVSEAIRHDPPPRSISPVKSALKHHHSPGSSVRTASPMATFSPAGPKAPASEVSDITSNASEDGFTEPPKKEKKRVRVSFDEQPKEIDAAGAVAVPKAISTLAGGSPMSIRDRSPAVDDEDLDKELSKPRPALPSFGSVRRNRGAEPEMAEKVTEMPPEREGTSNDRAVTGISNDHAIAGILSNAHAQQNENAEVPLPPEVTSKDEAGYVSDASEEGSSFRPEVASTPAKPLDARKLSVDEVEMPKTRDFAAENLAPHAQSSSSQDADVPAINLQPPTPGLDAGQPLGEEAKVETSPRAQRSFEAFNVPGSWADESRDDTFVTDSAPVQQQSPPTTQERIESILAQPVVQQSAQDNPTPAPIESSTPPSRQPAPMLDVLDEESDDSAAFSDAAEDLSDLEDGGFGSLNAIVSSPVVAPAEVDARAVDVEESPSAGPSAKRQQQLTHDAQESGDWTKATAYWSQLSKQQRQQIEREHMSDDEDARPAPAVAKKPKKKVSTNDVPATAPPIAQQQAMPKTLRSKPSPAPAPVESETHMRRSMRGNTGNSGSMQTTMRRGPEQRPQSEYTPQHARNNVPPRPKSSGGQGQAPSRLGPGGLPFPQGAIRPRTDSESSMPVRASQDSSFPRVAGNRQQAPPRMQKMGTRNQVESTGQSARADVPTAPSGAFTAKLQRQTTNDSDSESSFRKKRRSTAGSADGRYTMKRSMRAGSIDSTSVDQRPTSPTPAAKRGGGAFSIRSLSPTGGGVFGRGKGEKIRESLRSGSVDAGAGGRRTTLRGNPPGPPARTMRAAPASSAAAPATSKPRFRSRFADSDDEDEGAPRRGGFRSRFADSDDEDEPASPPLRPVRGIPRRVGQDDGDSTDLDSEDEFDSKDPRARQKSAKPMVPAAADVEKAMEAARRKLGIPEASAHAVQSTEGETLGKGSLRKPAPDLQTPASPQPQPAAARPGLEPEKKKRSFMGSILRRNRSSQVGVPQLPQGSPVSGSPVVASQDSPQVNGRSPDGKAAEVSIPSSPSTGKLVRRSSNQPQPQMKRGDSSFSTATAPSGALGSKGGDNWPIPPVPPIPASAADAERPNTSDGVNPEAIKLARTMRPDVGSRSQSGQVLPTNHRESNAGRSVGFAPGSKEEDGDAGGAGIYSRRTGKKKKFSALRKAFGLYD